MLLSSAKDTEILIRVNKTYTNLTQPSFRGFCRQFIKSRAKATGYKSQQSHGGIVESGFCILKYNFSKIFIVIR